MSANGNVAPTTTRKLLDVIANSETKLKIEIAATVDAAGKPFVKKTYGLEGDDAINSGIDILEWWKRHEKLLPSW